MDDKAAQLLDALEKRAARWEKTGNNLTGADLAKALRELAADIRALADLGARVPGGAPLKGPSGIH